jgi:hypothetical protein
MSAIHELEAQALSVPDRAKGLVIETDEQFVKAGELLKAIKALRAEIDQTFDPIIGKAHEAHKEAIAQKKKVDAPLVEAEGLLKPRIARYLEDQERKRRAEELRLQKLAQEEAERQQLADAALLDDIGETAMANALIEEKVYTPPVVLPRTAPKIAGITVRETWSAQVVNLMDLVKAVAAGRAPIQALQANTVFLNQQARSLKNAMNWPGVRAVSDSNVAAGRK